MATFVGGMGSPFPQPATPAADHGLGAPAASVAAPGSSAADVAPVSHEVAAAATPVPFVGGLGSPVATSSSPVDSFEGVGSPASSHSEAAAPVAWFAPAAHVDASGIQWFANV